MKKKNKGFTLIELLCVIVILGLLIAIAVPTITNFITTSRKKTLVNTINQYMDAVAIQVNNMEYYFTGTKVSYGSQRVPLIYAVPIECIDLEGGGKDPFGETRPPLPQPVQPPNENSERRLPGVSGGDQTGMNK